jgi:hypothetical protein
MGKLAEQGRSAGRSTFVPKNLRNNSEIRAIRANATHLHVMEKCGIPVLSANFEAKHVFLGDKATRKKSTRADKFFAVAMADLGVNTKQKHNNQPYKRLDRHLGRVFLCCDGSIGPL